jgi:hypothetical protein
MKFSSDIDIDFGDRSSILKHITYVPASIDPKTAHNTGIYVTKIPQDPITGRASLDYRSAEKRGYIKLDFLNVGIYAQIRSETELVTLMNQEPPWARLYDPRFCEQLIHIGNHHSTLQRMPEPVDSIPRLAMFLAVIRPAKRHLIGQIWAEVAKSIWQKSEDEYYFKRAHGIAYAHLVVVHMNLLNLTQQSN